MNFLAIIPARYASSRFEGKPLADIFGKPMIQRVYERASRIFEYCVVATDDPRIEQAVTGFGGIAVMTSPDHKSGTDRCYEACCKAESMFGREFGIVVNIQGDEPFIHPSQLLDIQSCFDDPDCQIATLIKPFAKDEDIRNPNSPKVVVARNGYALYFSRSVIPFLRSGGDPAQWNCGHVFFKHIGLYAYRKSVLKEITALEQGTLEKCESLEQLRWLENGYRIRTAVTLQESHAIDTPDDLEYVLTHYKDRLDV